MQLDARRFWILLGTLLVGATSASGQSLGTFSWQLQPYCNRLVVEVVSTPSGFTLAGVDDQCGNGPTGRVVGTAQLSGPDAVVLRAQSVVAGVKDVHVIGTISLATLSGTWTDSGGLQGTMTFGGFGVGAVWPTPALPQRRVTGTCAADSMIQTINADGTVVCGVASGTLADDSITTAKLANGAVTSSKLASGAVTAAGLADGSVTTAKLSAAAVTAAKVDTASVQARVSSSCAAGSAIRVIAADGTVTCESDDVGTVAAGSIGTVQLADASVTAAKIATGAVTGARAGTANVGIGPSALAAVTSGQYNTALGHSALALNTTGTYNTAVGASALADNTTGFNNTAFGPLALTDNTTGSSNTAIGLGTLSANTTGTSSTAVGHNVLASNTTGFWNTAVGFGSLAGSTTGNSNTALGLSTLTQNTTGNGNTAVGRQALNANVTGSNNTAVGNGSGPADGSTNLSNTTAIGYGVEVTTSDTVAIGNASVTRTVIQGIRGRTTGNANAVAVVIDSAGQLGTVSSSARTKDNIAPLPPEMSQRVLALRPVQFTYKVPFADGTQPVQYGLIAEEVEQVMPELVAYNDAGEVETVTYHVLPALLLNEVQRLERERAAQTAQLHAQAVQLAAQSAQLASQAADLSELRALVDSLVRQLAQQR